MFYRYNLQFCKKETTPLKVCHWKPYHSVLTIRAVIENVIIIKLDGGMNKKKILPEGTFFANLFLQYSNISNSYHHGSVHIRNSYDYLFQR